MKWGKEEHQNGLRYLSQVTKQIHYVARDCLADFLQPGSELNSAHMRATTSKRGRGGSLITRPISLRREFLKASYWVHGL
jgi:hypothetical protein